MAKRLGLFFAILLMVSLLFVLTVLIPELLYPPLSETQLAGVEKRADRIALAEGRLKLQNDARVAMIQAMGGLFFVVTAYYGWQQVLNSRTQLDNDRNRLVASRNEQIEQIRLSRDQLRVSEEGQITERFTRAIDQLGHGSVAVQVGGIFALERVARESISDRRPIYETLGAYIRENARVPRDSGPATPGRSQLFLRSRAPGVQAAITVLGRVSKDMEHLKPGGGAMPLELVGVNLSYGFLAGLDLRNILLNEADLRGAFLMNADLSGTSLEGSNLREANLAKATLFEVNLQGAEIQGANLRDARQLERANLHGAIANAATRWPDGFNSHRAGIIVADD